MPVTLDASVVCKWYLPQRGESDFEHAVVLAKALRAGELVVVQPVHWLAEVTAVLTRALPRIYTDLLDTLFELQLPVFDAPLVYHTAARLASEYRVHLFDSLYHAVALETPGCALVTADERYWRAARDRGHIVLLRDWQRAALR